MRLLAPRHHDQDTAVVAVQGEIDLGTAPALREVLLRPIENQTGPVLVDLSAVPFMDSTGVHVLIDALERLRLQDRQLAIISRRGGQVSRVLALVGLLDTVTVYGSRESALVGGDDRIRSEDGRGRRAYAT